MPHQCVHCGTIYPDASKELLEGCSCGSRFFFYMSKDLIEKAREVNEKLVSEQLNEDVKQEIEKDVREIIGAENEDVPVILDLESVRVLSPGKFEIDIVNIFNGKKPIVYKLEEGKYIIDLASTLKQAK